MVICGALRKMDGGSSDSADRLLTSCFSSGQDEATRQVDSSPSSTNADDDLHPVGE